VRSAAAVVASSHELCRQLRIALEGVAPAAVVVASGPGLSGHLRTVVEEISIAAAGDL